VSDSNKSSGARLPNISGMLPPCQLHNPTSISTFSAACQSSVWLELLGLLGLMSIRRNGSLITPSHPPPLAPDKTTRVLVVFHCNLHLRCRDWPLPALILPDCCPVFIPAAHQSGICFQQQGSGTADSEVRYGLTQVDCI